MRLQGLACFVAGSLFGQPHIKAVTRVKKPKAAKPKKEEPQPNAEAIAKIAASRRAAFPPRRTDFEPKRSREYEEAFLDGLRESWSVSKSAWAANISVPTVYRWRAASEASVREDGSYVDDFCVRWKQADEAGVDKLEDEIKRRGFEGVEKPVYQGGVLVGSVTEYSDTLAGLVMRGKRPGIYNTERHEHTGKDGDAIKHSIALEFVDPPKEAKK